MYDTPTGKIIGGPYLGKSYICDGWFPETAPNVDPKVSSLYYAADRKYNIHKVLDAINAGYNVILEVAQSNETMFSKISSLFITNLL